MSFLINGGIPEGDLPVKSPSGAARVRYVDGDGKSYSSAMPDVIAASALVQDAIDGVVASAEAEIGVIVNGMGYLPPVAFASGLNVDSGRFTVTYGGVTYAPVADAIPFTTTGTFNPAQWRVVQGVTAADLGAASGAALVGFKQAGAGAVSRTAEEKLRSMPVDPRDYGAVGDGVSNDGPAIRAMFAGVPAGSVITFKSGAYLLDQDGVNPWCILVDRPFHFVFESGVRLVATTPGVRAVVNVTGPITSDGHVTVDGNFKTNHAVEVSAGARGAVFRRWVGCNVTQQHNASFSAAVFSVVSEAGVTFDRCYAHDAVAYPNSTIGDAAGTSRGFHFYGTAAIYGENAVINSRVENIINTNGISGVYEDEDGIVTQMSNSHTRICGNHITSCMKRGIKVQNPATVQENTIVSIRTESDNQPSSSLRMYSGISVYSHDVVLQNNVVGSGAEFGESIGGSFTYPIELGASGQEYRGISSLGNYLSIGHLSSARSVEFFRLWGCLTQLEVRGNRCRVASGVTVNQTWGVRADFDHPTLYATVDISDNRFSNTATPMLLRGGVSGIVSGNVLSGWNGVEGGIVIDPSPSALRPKNITLSSNSGRVADDYTVRINDTGATGVVVVSTLSEATTKAAVYIHPSIRAQQDTQGFGATLSRAVCYMGAPPTSGTWSRGDRVVNPDPRDASPVVAWQCLYGGTPGTWRASSWLTPTGSSGSRPVLTTSDTGVMYLDTSLAAGGKPVWWTGSAWKDATGTTV